MSLFTKKGFIMSTLLLGLLVHILIFSTSKSIESRARWSSNSWTRFYPRLRDQQGAYDANKDFIKKRINLIVMSPTPRSGSSYLGELLSSSHNSAFFFEPLWYFIDTKVDIPSTKEKIDLFKDLLSCNFHNPVIRKILQSGKKSAFIFRKPSTLHGRQEFGMSSFRRRIMVKVSDVVRRMEQRCKRTSVRVIKTIRFGLAEVKELLDSLPDVGSVSYNNLYLLYLVRDPRAVLNSIQDMKSEWPQTHRNPEFVCTKMLNDSQAGVDDLFNMKIVRYEDAVEKPMELLSSIYRQFNITAVPKESKQFISDHSAASWKKIPSTTVSDIQEVFKTLSKMAQEQAEDLAEDMSVEPTTSTYDDGTKRDTPDYYDNNGNIPTLKRRKRSSQLAGQPAKANDVRDQSGRVYYYSTYRKKSFTPDHWKSQMTREEVQAINSVPECHQVLKLYNYTTEF